MELHASVLSVILTTAVPHARIATIPARRPLAPTLLTTNARHVMEADSDSCLATSLAHALQGITTTAQTLRPARVAAIPAKDAGDQTCSVQTAIILSIDR